ncbi:11022_t:CDS:2, partial [Paraglomus occultum]
MSNWRNPNNWTSKNCLNWAKDYFGRELIGVTVEHDGTTVKTDKLEDCKGDVDLSQRKGRLITIYDVALNIEYSGTSAAGNYVKGRIKFPEVAHDTDLKDLAYTITADEDMDDYEIVKEVARNHLIPALKERLGKFAHDLVETHRPDVYIDPSQMGAVSTPRPVTPIASSSDVTSQKPSPASTTTTSSASAKTLLNTKTIKETVEFQTSADQLYETLLDPGRVAAWTRARPDIFKTVGSHYNLFDGNITGVMLELIPNEKITQTWRLKSWPEGHYSNVTMTFEQTSDSTKLHLTQTGVPIGELQGQFLHKRLSNHRISLSNPAPPPPDCEGKERRKKEMSESVPGISHDPLNRPMPGSLHRRRALVKG